MGGSQGLDAILNRYHQTLPVCIADCAGSDQSAAQGKGSAKLKLHYKTGAGLKCLYVATGTVQEVFLICSDAEKATQWLKDEGLIEAA